MLRFSALQWMTNHVVLSLERVWKFQDETLNSILIKKVKMLRLQLSLQVKQLPWLLYSLQNDLTY